VMISTTFSAEARLRANWGRSPHTACGRIGAFTLLEVTVMLVVLSVLGTLLVPASLKLIATQKVSSTQDEMGELFDAMTGHGSSSSFGFLGDLGRLPVHLSELVSSGDCSLSTTDTAYQVRMGWDGPYIMKSVEDVTTDAFGRGYRFDENDEGKIWSAGPDGRFETDDDIIYPPADYRPYGSVRIEIDSDPEEEAPDYTVRLYYSDCGEEKHLEATVAPYLFEDAHRGPHAVEVLDADGGEVLASELIVLESHTGLFRIEL